MKLLGHRALRFLHPPPGCTSIVSIAVIHAEAREVRNRDSEAAVAHVVQDGRVGAAGPWGLPERWRVKLTTAGYSPRWS
jgi:hypothetical protein